MTQNNERELIERLTLVVIDLRRSHNGFDFIASLSELEAFAKAYKVAIDANDKSPISQNEQQEVIGEVVNERGYSEVFVDFFDKPPPPNGTPLYTSPPKQIPDGWKLVPIEPTPEMLEKIWQLSRTNDFTEDAYEGVIKQKASIDYKAMINASPTNTEV